MSALTTTDNPYDPYTHWREWLAWDRQAGYHTPGLLARILDAAGADFDDEAAIEAAIDRIVALNVSGVHRKVEEPGRRAEPVEVDTPTEPAPTEDAPALRSRTLAMLRPPPPVDDIDDIAEVEWAEILDEMRAEGVDLDEWGELRAVDDNALKRYWTVGKGLKRWRFHPHPWTRLRNLLRKHVGPGRAERMASEWFHKVFGYWPGHRKGLNPVGPG